MSIQLQWLGFDLAALGWPQTLGLLPLTAGRRLGACYLPAAGVTRCDFLNVTTVAEDVKPTYLNLRQKQENSRISRVRAATVHFCPRFQAPPFAQSYPQVAHEVALRRAA